MPTKNLSLSCQFSSPVSSFRAFGDLFPGSQAVRRRIRLWSLCHEEYNAQHMDFPESRVKLGFQSFLRIQSPVEVLDRCELKQAARNAETRLGNILFVMLLRTIVLSRDAT